MKEENNKNQEQMNESKLKFRLYEYHFPNGQTALMLPLAANCEVEVIPVYPNDIPVE